MGFAEKGAVRIHYEEAGSGYPLLLIAGGGLNSCIERITGPYPPFNAMKEFSGEFRCIAFDLRNAIGGQSSGPLEVDRPWDAYLDDMLGLMDHLGIGRFFCGAVHATCLICWFQRWRYIEHFFKRLS